MKPRIRIGVWRDLAHDARAIREAVFVREQSVPMEREMDEWDARSVHALAFVEGQAVGTARLLPDGHIGRMAVLSQWRRSGIGTALLQALMARAREDGHAEVVLNAQVQATAFYARAGFVPRGGEFDDAGIPHVEMRLRLD